MLGSSIDNLGSALGVGPEAVLDLLLRQPALLVTNVSADIARRQHVFHKCSC